MASANVDEFFDFFNNYLQEQYHDAEQAWTDFFASDTWHNIQQAPQDAITQLNAFLEEAKNYYEDTKNKITEMLGEGEDIPYAFDVGSDSETYFAGYYKLASTGDTLYPATWCNLESSNVRETICFSQHFKVEGYLKYYYTSNGRQVINPGMLPDNATSEPYSTVNEYGIGQRGFKITRGDTTTNSYMGGYRDLKGFFLDAQNGSSGTTGATIACYSIVSIPTHTAGTVLPITRLTGAQVITVPNPPGQIKTETPWTYYNDTVLPYIRDTLLPNIQQYIENFPTDTIPFYPAGYDPGDNPPEPDPEPEDDPEIDDINGDREPDNFDGTFAGANNFISAYILNSALVSKFGRLMWRSPLAWGVQGSPFQDAWKNFLFSFDITRDTGSYDIASLMEFVVSLKVFPFDFSSMAGTMVSQSSGLRIGAGLTDFLEDDTTYSLDTFIATMQLGTATVPQIYDGDYRDYDDTTVTVHLPYCGSTQLNASVVSGKTLSVAYAIDFITGGCTAVVTVAADSPQPETRAGDDPPESAGFVAASLPGKIGFMIPVTATNQGQVATRARQTFFDAAQNMVSSGVSMLTGVGMGRAALPNLDRYANTTHSPMIGGDDMSSFCLSNKPTLIVTRSRYKTPSLYRESVGKMSTKCGTIGSFSGWTIFRNPDLSGITATETEKAKIFQILENGVFV